MYCKVINTMKTETKIFKRNDPVYLPEDFIQKTWIPEGSKEYGLFKLRTLENEELAQVIQKHVSLAPSDLVLDVGGRDGNVAFAIQDPQYVHIVDPDPTVTLLKKPGKFWNNKIQNVRFDPKDKYKLIICCHVMGYLGLQDVQERIVDQLTSMLEADGCLVLCYNSNNGYMKELLEYSKHVLPYGHYDYLEDRVIQKYRMPGWDIKRLDVSFPLQYPSFKKLAKCCWFLFGGVDPHIEKRARQFLPKLQNDLIEPTFEIDERISLIFKRNKEFLLPTLE